jgi:hypothetical protein
MQHSFLKNYHKKGNGKKTIFGFPDLTFTFAEN